MQIEIFNDLTTEQSLVIIEKEAAKYDGLHVEMSNNEQRKFVKGHAANIKELLKKLESSRIEKTKVFRGRVEEEADRIKDRLEKANKPFTILIDEYKEKCAKKLADERAAQAAKDLIIQIGEDHGNAITLDKIRTFEIEDAIRQQKERDEAIAKEASERAEKDKEKAEERAEQAEKDRILAEARAKREKEEAEERHLKAVEKAKEQAKKNEEEAVAIATQAEINRQAMEEADKLDAQRKIESNKRHVGAIRCKIKEQLMKSCDIGELMAKKIVLSLIKMDNITINY